MKLKALAVLLTVVVSLSLIVGCEQSTSPVDNAAEQSIDLPEAGTLIEGSYIVVLKDRTSLLKSTPVGSAAAQMQQKAVDVLERNKIRRNSIDRVYSRVLAGFSAKISAEEAAKLSKDDKIAYVEQDMVITRGPGNGGGGGGPTPPEPPAEVIPWGITRVGGAVNYTGNNVAWVIDTGVDYDNADLNVDISRSVNFIDPASTADDDNGHGTHVAGTIAAIDNDINVVGVAAGATVVGVKVLARNGSGSTTGVIAGIDYVAANGSPGDVANMSLSGGISEALDAAVLAASNNGIYFSLAAGNESSDANYSSPARVNGPYVYTVSASDINDDWAYFSNYGNPPVDYCAPGYGVISLAPGGSNASMSGTSMSAPHVAGILLSTGGNISADGTVNGDPDGYPD
ncbi:MAG TPA: S8 family serine peptidase, partial [Candidatus Krumholzibacteriaceae bacterium]|nr:S8 family serine peptidase [Candidatus Krumholzibacteriaceae bacterium]